MKKGREKVVSFVAILALMITAAPAFAEVIDFEDLPNVSFSYVPTSYHGLTWSGGVTDNSWVVNQESSAVFSGVNVYSGLNYVWSNGANDLSISSGSTFDFISLWARIGNLTSGTATARGFLGGTELFTQTLELTDSYQFFDLGFVGIDQWTLTDQLNNVLIDDITINSASAVPEPSSFALLGLGGLGLAIGAYRRRRMTAV